MRIAPTLLLAAATALALPSGTASADSALPVVERWTLPNGLAVAHVHVAGSPVVAVQMWYRAGSKDEPAERRGMARMFQSLLFQGSTHLRPGAHLAHLREVGGNAGASVIEDATTLQNVAPAAYFEHILRLEADRMRGLEWRDEIVKGAADQAQAELRQAMADPLKRAVQPFLELAFGDHPYAWESIGAEADIKRVQRADLEAFYKTYYVPDNALLVVVGGVTRPRAEAAVQKHFGSFEKGGGITRKADGKARAAQTEARKRTLAAGQIGVLMRGYHIPAARHKDIYALQVLSLVLGAGPGGAFADAVVEKGKLAVQAGATAIVREHPGLFLTYAAFDKPGNEAALEKAMQDAVSALAARPPGAKQLAAARNAILADFVFRIETVEGLASQVGMSWVLTGDPGQFISDVAELEAVSAADIARVISLYLVAKNSVTVVVPMGTR